MLAEKVRFDRFELQPRERRLLVDGSPAALGARAFDVLLVLVGRAGELVTKNELLEQVWTGLVVEEANLTVQVSSLRKVLGGELISTIPGRGYRFTGVVEQPSPARAEAPAPAPATASPAATPAPGPHLVGRDAELALLRQALATPGCVSLVGPAGVGKTSLARVLASEWREAAVWVDLAPLTEAAQVGPALARALDLAPDAGTAALLRALGPRLLVLDNAEHLIDASAQQVAALLQQSPTLRLLATCQLPLGVPQERVVRVEPLGLPAAGETLEDAQGALALFIERARGADHRFNPPPSALPLLREICRQLDGLPLALEMAAARVPALGLQGLHDALVQRFAVLTRGQRSAAARHRTLQAALDWSQGLLDEPERRLFRALGVFAGGFTLDLMLAVVQPETGTDRWALVESLSVLVDRSLVAVDATEPPRYRLLETMRAYALDKLQAAGETEALHRRHAQAVLELFTRAHANVANEAQRSAALAEHDNAREALAWSLQHEPALAVALAPRVSGVATYCSWRIEALRWLERCEPVLEGAGISPALRAEWWHERARQLLMSRRPEAHGAAVHAHTLFRELGDERGCFMAAVARVRSRGEPVEALPALCRELQALNERHPEWAPRMPAVLAGTLAVAANCLGDNEAELHHRLDEVHWARQVGVKGGLDSAESNVIAALHNLERYDEALAHCERMLARLGDEDSINVAYVWNYRLVALLGLGRHDELRRLAAEASARMLRYELPFLGDTGAQMLANEQRPRGAARLIGHTKRLMLQFGMNLHNGPVAESLQKTEARVRPLLGDAVHEALVAEGRELDEAAALAVLCSPGPDG